MTSIRNIRRRRSITRAVMGVVAMVAAVIIVAVPARSGACIRAMVVVMGEARMGMGIRNINRIREAVVGDGVARAALLIAIRQVRCWMATEMNFGKFSAGGTSALEMV